jgi:molybdopterin-guanine dinucleotide biosynthesis protein A
MTISANDISGLILAGGRSTRMGGRDKGLQILDRQPMITHIIERLQPQVGRLLINANQNQEAYELFGLPIIADVISNFVGPLAGLHAGLSYCSTPYLLSVPCDCPFLPTDLVRRLSHALMSSGADVAYAITINQNQTEHHPVFCLLKRDVMVGLGEYLSEGGRKVLSWVSCQPHVQVVFDDHSAFLNINTPDDLKTINASRWA